MLLEEMSSFFTKRVDGYDEHMLNNVEGCKEGYKIMAESIPDTTKTILDLGCGTGLELDEIFKRLPHIKTTGLDLTQAMLDKLKEKHPDKDLTLIDASYFDYDFVTEAFDLAISFETLHQFPHEKKIDLYSKLYHALKKKGAYIECDYMAPDQEYEDFYFAENRRLRAEMSIAYDEFYHYDTPCTVENQMRKFLSMGRKNNVV